MQYPSLSSDFTIDMETQKVKFLNAKSENWKVTVIDTGLHTLTGGRIKRAVEMLEINETFMMTYGDGLANIDLTALLKLHKNKNKLCTLTAVTPPGRFGLLDIDDNKAVLGFREKSS